jgi:hypothetical protein
VKLAGQCSKHIVGHCEQDRHPLQGRIPEFEILCGRFGWCGWGRAHATPLYGRVSPCEPLCQGLTEG